MCQRWMRFRIVVAIMSIAGGLFSLAAPVSAAVDMYDGNLRWTFIPYLWFPTVNGTFNITTPGARGSGSGILGPVPPPGTTISGTIGPNSYLTNLNFAFLGYLEARKENWSAFTDVITMSLGNQTSSIDTVDFGQGPTHIERSANINTTTDIQTTFATLAASYTLVHKDMSTLDVFLGGQLASVNVTANWSLNGPRDLFPQSGSAGAGSTLVDGVVGIKGSLQLGGADSRWFLPYYFDGGAGGYSTYEGMAGIGYAFSWGDVLLTYRHLYVDMGSGGLVQSLTLSGPMLGVAFHW
jgi:hypothetical protein